MSGAAVILVDGFDACAIVDAIRDYQLGSLLLMPLMATLLLDTACEKVDAIATAKFHAEGPASCGIRLVLSGLRHGREVRMLAQTYTGAPVMRATIMLRE